MKIVTRQLCAVHFHALFLGGVAAELLDTAPGLRSKLVDRLCSFAVGLPNSSKISSLKQYNNAGFKILK